MHRVLKFVTRHQIEYDDERSAVRAVKRNDLWAAAHFPENYTQSSVTIFQNDTRVPFEKMKAWVDLSSNVFSIHRLFCNYQPSETCLAYVCHFVVCVGNYVGRLVKWDMLYYYKQHWEAALQQCGLSPQLMNYPGGVSVSFILSLFLCADC